MKKSLLALIRCPDCGFALSLVNASSTNAEIISGNLLCEVCRASFPIEEGLPVILRSDRRSERTRQSFGRQWTLHEQRRFEQETIYGKKPEEGLEDFRRAYNEGGLTSAEFDSFPPTVRTLRQFIAACHDLDGQIREFMLPNPD